MPDHYFPRPAPGEHAQRILRHVRGGLRGLRDPETGALLTEEQVQEYTAAGSYAALQADATDGVLRMVATNTEWTGDQHDPDTASTEALEAMCSAIGLERLPATRAALVVRASGDVGAVLVGDAAQIPSPTATRAQTADGALWQVQSTVSVPAGSTTVDVSLVAITPGVTRVTTDEEVTWQNAVPSITAKARVIEVSAGSPAEKDANLSRRYKARKRFRVGAGNPPQLREWARDASSAVHDAFVYCWAHGPGTAAVAVTRVRSTQTQTAHLADAVTTERVRQALNWSRVPVGAGLITVLSVQPENCDVVIRLALRPGSASGWANSLPFPAYHATCPTITTVTSQTDIRITCPGNATLPGQSGGATLTGANAPRIMVWSRDDSAFYPLGDLTISIQDLGSNVFRVLLSAAPAFTLRTGQRVSPDVGQREFLTAAIVDYFDGLAPGQIRATSVQWGEECQRFPSATEDTIVTDVTSELALRCSEALGGVAFAMPSVSVSSPSLPSLPSDGPRMLVAGHIGVFAL